MNKLLSLNNWQIFALLFLLPLIIQILAGIAGIGFENNLIYSAVAVLSWIFLLIAWIFLIANRLKTQFTKEFELSLLKISLSILFSVYVIVIITLLKDKNSANGFLSSNFEKIKSLSFVINLYQVLCVLYTSYFISKSLSQKKLNRLVKLSDYKIYFIQFLFLPIGIFWLQKMINNLIGISKTSDRKTSLVLGGTLIFLGLLIILLYFNKPFHITKSVDNQEQHIAEVIKNSNQDFETYDNSTKAKLLSKGASQLYSQGNFRAAINNLTYAISLDSTKALYFFNRGVILKEEFNQIDSAIVDMSKAIKIDSTQWKVIHNRGLYYFLKADYSNAIIDFNKVIEINPRCDAAFYLRGEIKLKFDDKNGACEDLKTAKDLGNPDALIRIMETCN